MSYTEYYDYFYRCQKTAPYHLFIFDVENSRNLSQIDNNYISKISLLIDKVYQKIEAIEKTTNKQILHRGPNIFRPQLIEYSPQSFYLQEPLTKKNCYTKRELCDPFQILGDTIGLTILRDSLTVEEVYNLFDQTKEELGITFHFHYANGYYETDDYSEGGTKLYRGYTIPILANKHKITKVKVKKKTAQKKDLF